MLYLVLWSIVYSTVKSKLKSGINNEKGVKTLDNGVKKNLEKHTTTLSYWIRR